MAETITFPDVEQLLVTILNDALPDGVTAHYRFPSTSEEPGVEEFVVITVAGGPVETLVTSAPQVIVDGYAPKRARAYEICDLALSIIRAQDGVIRGARGFNYPQNLPDPVTSRIRYTSTGEVRVWGAAHP